MSLNWKLLKYSSPAIGEECVVGRNAFANHSRIRGIFKYHSNYWENSQGMRIETTPYDNWCPVEDIISSVADMVIDSFKEELTNGR